MNNTYTRLTPLYLRDLSPSVREGFERTIRKDRLDLVSALDADYDIAIGGFYAPKDFIMAD